MKRGVDLILVIGFLLVDWLIFHDLLKGGESYTLIEYLTGVLSLPVIFFSIKSLLRIR